MSDFPDILKSDIKYEIILTEYYRRDIKSKFIYPSGANGERLFTIKMIANKTAWLDEKLSCIKNKMEELGYKEIKFEMMGDYIEMTDSEVDNHIKFGELMNTFDDWWKENFPSGFNIDSLTNMDIAKLYSSIIK